MAFAAVVVVLAFLLAAVLYKIWFLPWKRRQVYVEQGIGGPPFHPIVGNHKERVAALQEVTKTTSVPLNHLIGERVLPDLHSFSKTYGNVFVHEILWTTMLTVLEPALVREVMVDKGEFYQKASIIRTLVLSVLGNGMVFSDGDFWKQQRRIHNPAFQKTFLRGLFRHFQECSDQVASRWRSKVRESGGAAEVEVNMEMSVTTLDIIARSAFGANIPGSAPTSKGVLAFESITPLFIGNLAKLFTIAPLIPGYRFLPTPSNVLDWRRERFINQLLEEVLLARLKATDNQAFDAEHPYGHDLLGFMIKAWKDGSSTMTRKQLLAECKTIFVAGHSTTALGITWALFLLSVHTEWQDKLRNEIREVVGDGQIDASTLGHLIQMDMFMKEVLRLYPPVANVFRECTRSHQIGTIHVAAGTVVIIPIVLLHQSKEQWGDDFHEFKPERWENKTAPSKHSLAYCTFGAGQRHCLGKEFALMETFTMLTTLLRQFHFTLSPAYKHAPGQPQSIRPLHGLQLIITEL